MTVAYRFIQPLDVLHFRGNASFGASGSHGAALMPPWPSVFAGALRTAMLASAGISPRALRTGLPEPFQAVLGTLAEPGSFRLSEVCLARQSARDGQVERLRALPADVQVFVGSDGQLEVERMRPVQVPEGMQVSSGSDSLPVLARLRAGKAAAGPWFLGEEGWAQWCTGSVPAAEHLVHGTSLWTTRRRVGIGMDVARRAAAESMLFSTDAIALKDAVGFLVGVTGCGGLLPEDTVIRLGGDGRLARLQRCQPVPDEGGPDSVGSQGFLCIYLETPALFPAGSDLPGQDGQYWSGPGALQGRVVAAVRGRPIVVSGWDLQKNAPKAALRAVPPGSVYWLAGIRDDPAARGKLAIEGLWPADAQNGFQQRRAEGFNAVRFGCHQGVS